jgi:predicted nucleic acid-binding protein
VTVLDAYAVIAFLRDEPAADQIRPLLEAGDGALTAVGLAEVLDHLVRLAGADEDDAVLDLAQLGLLDAIPINAGTGNAAGRLRSRHYHRTRCPISMADCIAAEIARATRRPLATADPDLLDVCHTEHVEVIALPGSDGTIWGPCISAVAVSVVPGAGGRGRSPGFAT